MIVRCPVKDIRSCGRSTQGVKLIALKENDLLVSVARVPASDEDVTAKEKKEETADLFDKTELEQPVETKEKKEDLPEETETEEKAEEKKPKKEKAQAKEKKKKSGATKKPEVKEKKEKQKGKK